MYALLVGIARFAKRFRVHAHLLLRIAIETCTTVPAVSPSKSLVELPTRRTIVRTGIRCRPSHLC